MRLLAETAHGRGLLVVTALTALCAALIPARPVSVFGVRDVFAVMWPLVPTALAAVTPMVVAVAGEDLARCAARGPIGIRARLLLVSTSPMVLAVTLASARFDVVVLARNACGLVGVALITASVLGERWGWVAPLVTASGCWLLGTQPGGAVRPAAVLLRAHDDEASMLVALTLGAFGAALALGRGVAPD